MHCVRERQGAYEVKVPCALRFDWTSALAPVFCGDRRPRSTCVAPHPSLVLTGQRDALSPIFCIGRYEGTEKFLGRRARNRLVSALVAQAAREPQYVCGAAT